MMEEISGKDEHQHMRRIAFLAIVLSTAAVISSIVTLPMLYGLVQTLESHLMVEADFCKVILAWMNFNGTYEIGLGWIDLSTQVMEKGE